jgi:hypothetical protein
MPVSNEVFGADITEAWGDSVADSVNALETDVGALDVTVAALPRGVLGRATRTTAQSGITTVTDITSMSVTWTATSSRLYRVSASGLVFSTVANDVAQLSMTDASNTVKALAQEIVAASPLGITIHVEWIVTGLSGSQTTKLRVARSGGSGSLTFDAAGTYPAYLTVEDIGPA